MYNPQAMLIRVYREQSHMDPLNSKGRSQGESWMESNESSRTDTGTDIERQCFLDNGWI